MKAVISVTICLAGLCLFSLSGTREVFGASAAGLAQTQDGGGVTVKVTYLNPKEADSARFQVALDTHSVNLDGYDLKTLALLRDETGKEFQPTKAENKGSGHHREVTLYFPKASPGAKKLKLVIKEIAGIKERSFQWDLR